MRFPTLPIWSAKKRSVASVPKDRSQVRVGIPKVLNIWTTHQFWVGFLRSIGIESENIVFSSDTSEEQGREFGKGRGTVDCCYPVKAISGHYGELVFGQKKKIHILLSPMIHSLPSVLHGHVVDTVCHWCPVTCQRSFIDVELDGGKGREWSKVPLEKGWERVIVNNSCPKGLVEDLNEMKVIKTEMEKTKNAFPNVADLVRKEAFRRVSA